MYCVEIGGGTAHAVSAHFGDGTVGIDDVKKSVIGRITARQDEDSVGADARVPVAEDGGVLGDEGEGSAVCAGVDENEIVARGFVFIKSDIHRHPFCGLKGALRARLASERTRDYRLHRAWRQMFFLRLGES